MSALKSKDPSIYGVYRASRRNFPDRLPPLRSLGFWVSVLFVRSFVRNGTLAQAANFLEGGAAALGCRSRFSGVT